MPYANIEANLSGGQQSEIVQKMKEMRDLMPFLVNLTPQEKRRGKLGQHNYAFLHAAFDYAKKNTNFLPPSFSLAGWQADIELYDNLAVIEQQVRMLHEGIADTMFALRTEAQKSALDFLKLAQIAEGGNNEGTSAMVSDLKSKLNKAYKPRASKSKPVEKPNEE